MRRKVSDRSKWMIFSSLALSVALIATVLLYFFRVSENGGATDNELWLVIGMIVLAVVTFGLILVYRLRRGRYERQLDEHYYAAFEKISDALNTSVLSYTEKKETRNDILSLLVEAQESGRAVEDVVGNDISGFIDKVKRSFGYRSGFLFNLLSSVQYGIILVTFVQIILYFENLGVKSFFDAQLGLSLFVMFIPLALIIYPLIKQQLRKENTTWAYILPFGYGVVFIGLLILLDNTAYHVPWVRYFLDAEMCIIFSWWMLALLAGVVVIAQLIKWGMRRQSINKL